MGISLQKLLIFFMVLDTIGMFGGDFLSSFAALLFHFIVFMGVYRRRTAVLCMYVVVHVVLFVIIALALFAFAALSVMYIPADGYDSYDYNSGDYINGTSSTYSYYSTRAMNFVKSYSFNYTSESESWSYSSSDNSISSASASDNEVSGALFLISVLVLIFVFVMVYTKILSVVLAHRMRKMLLAQPVLPVQHDADAQTMEPTYIPADFETQQHMFANPAFMPYAPMVPMPMNPNQYPGNQQQAMVPPPFMYGQQPVFYTFAPMPINSERNEKL